MKRVHVFIKGRVQGVFFRSFVKKNALELKLNGWVKNLEDNSVEAVFEGENKEVEEMLKLCKKGPIGAKVKSLEVLEERYEGETGFKVVY